MRAKISGVNTVRKRSIPRLVQDTRRAAQQAIVQCDKGAGEVSHFARHPAFRTTFSTLRWLRSFSASILLSARSAIWISASASICWASASPFATRLV
jgi:hypothetical protein